MNPTIHVAGAVDPDKVQRCNRCHEPLKDFRIPGLDRPRDSEPLAYSGGCTYPEGALITRGENYQCMALGLDVVATCIVVGGKPMLQPIRRRVCECRWGRTMHAGPGAHHPTYCPMYRAPVAELEAVR